MGAPCLAHPEKCSVLCLVPEAEAGSLCLLEGPTLPGWVQVSVCPLLLTEHLAF